MRKAMAALLWLLAACGPSAEHRRFDAFRDACNGLVASGATVQEAVQRLGGSATLLECTPGPQQPLGGGVDRCDYLGPVCQVFWVGYASDQSLCGPPVGGCYFWCEVRVPGSTVPPPTETVVCGAWFVSGQPCAPYTC